MYRLGYVDIAGRTSASGLQNSL